ncbi:hypothetical protein JHK86_047868 [Glycine max]|nr:hypothetical protein JHK86_047868 [Glycine max]
MGTPTQNLFNGTLMKGRSVVVEAIALLKGRWNILQDLNTNIQFSPLYSKQGYSFVICKPCKLGQVHEYAEELARLSKGIMIDIKPNNTIIFLVWKELCTTRSNVTSKYIIKSEALRPLRIRLGGSLQDQVLYDVGSLKSPCHPLQKVKGGLFGFSKGCLHMKRWDELNQFFYETG